MEKLFELISILENKLELLKGDIEEHDEMYGDFVDPMDASGGNFDDAYELGFEHGEMFKEYNLMKGILKSLNEIVESSN